MGHRKMRTLRQGTCKRTHNESAAGPVLKPKLLGGGSLGEAGACAELPEHPPAGGALPQGSAQHLPLLRKGLDRAICEGPGLQALSCMYFCSATTATHPPSASSSWVLGTPENDSIQQEDMSSSQNMCISLLILVGTMTGQ